MSRPDNPRPCDAAEAVRIGDEPPILQYRTLTSETADDGCGQKGSTGTHSPPAMSHRGDRGRVFSERNTRWDK